MTIERSRFSAAMMRSVEVGIHRSALGHTRAHLDPACAGAGAASVVAATAAEAEARLISSAAILVVLATAARRIRRARFPFPPTLPPPRLMMLLQSGDVRSALLVLFRCDPAPVPACRAVRFGSVTG